MADPVEQFNQHQTDTKARFNFLVQSIFLLAGGALTASIAVFTGSRTIALSHTQGVVLGFGWWFLVGSICLALTSSFFVVLRDYLLGERWRKVIDGAAESAGDAPGKMDAVILTCGIASLASFLLGFIAIAWVATSTVVA